MQYYTIYNYVVCTRTQLGMMLYCQPSKASPYSSQVCDMHLTGRTKYCKIQCINHTNLFAFYTYLPVRSYTSSLSVYLLTAQIFEYNLLWLIQRNKKLAIPYKTYITIHKISCFVVINRYNIRYYLKSTYFILYLSFCARTYYKIKICFEYFHYTSR